MPTREFTTRAGPDLRVPSGSALIFDVAEKDLFARRTLLKGGAAAVAATAVAAPRARASGPVFLHGVASGDPLPTGVIIWTRVTVSEDAAPGSAEGEPAAVYWEVARDEGFTQVVASGAVVTSTETDHTVKIDVSGLAPARDYLYRFTAFGQPSPTGRTRTAPAANSSPEQLRFGVVSCANWEAGAFGAYRGLAERGDLDAIVHLGDYLYEYARGEHGTGVRAHDPAHEIVTLSDYRTRHGQYKTDPDLMALHARVPFVCTWDDHESANNSWSGGARNHDPVIEGAWADRSAASARAYLEWMPVRAAGAGDDLRIYRRLRFGDLAELSMLDLRSYRDQEIAPGAQWRNVDDPERSITGHAQLEWLTAGLVSAPVRWKLVGNSVMITPLLFPPLDPATTQAVTGILGIPRHGAPINGDQWDGYTADRRRLFEAITVDEVDNVVFLTGDIHSSWAADLPVTAADPNGPSAGAEFVVPSVTSASIGDLLAAPPRTTAVSVETAIATVNPHLRYVELESHGYGVLDVTRERTQMDWFYLENVADPRSPIRHGASFAVPSGGRIERRPDPIG